MESKPNPRTYGASVPSGQLGNTDPHPGTSRNDLFNIDLYCGLRKIEYDAGLGENTLSNVSGIVSSSDDYKYQVDLLDNTKGPVLGAYPV